MGILLFGVVFEPRLHHILGARAKFKMPRAWQQSIFNAIVTNPKGTGNAKIM